MGVVWYLVIVTAPTYTKQGYGGGQVVGAGKDLSPTTRESTHYEASTVVYFSSVSESSSAVKLCMLYMPFMHALE